MFTEMIIKFFEKYGIIMTILATSGIFFVGFLKSLGIFSKLNNKIKKYVYFILASIASIISCTIYLCMTNQFEWIDWGVGIACVISYTLTVYSLYENLGIRALLKKIIFKPVKHLWQSLVTLIVTKNISQEKIIELVKKLGNDVICQIAEEVKVETIEKESKSIDEKIITTETKEKQFIGDNSNQYIEKHFFS